MRHLSTTLAAVFSIALARDPGEDLQEVVQRSRCFPEDHRSIFKFGRFGDQRRWVLEVAQYPSQLVVTTIAAILLHEQLGYAVDVNHATDMKRSIHRLAKQWSGDDGPVVAMLLAANSRSFGYANMELSAIGVRNIYEEIITLGHEAIDLGTVGYSGRQGLYIPTAFANDPALLVSPEFYRAYSSQGGAGSQAVLNKLAQRGTTLCSPAGSRTLWCPVASPQSLPFVISEILGAESDDFTKAILQSHSMRLAVQYLTLASHINATSSAVRAGAPQVFHMRFPSLLHSYLRVNALNFTRITFPSEECGDLLTTGTGQWSCDFPEEVLVKATSLETESDPVAKTFFERFRLQARRGPQVTGLEGAGIAELLDTLVARGRQPSAQDIYEVACEWVLANDGKGTDWNLWLKPRFAPFFADTLLEWYQYPLTTILMFVALALAYVLILENPWLWSTLSQVKVRKIMAKHKETSFRSNLELQLRTKSRSSLAQEVSDTVHTVVQAVDEQPLRPGYWHGLLSRCEASTQAQSFWKKAEAWVTKARSTPENQDEAEIQNLDFVRFAHHTFPCTQKCGTVAVVLYRSLAGTDSGKVVSVEVELKETSGGAKKGRDFEGGLHQVTFQAGANHAVLRVPIVYLEDVWENVKWFDVILKQVLDGDAVLATPDSARVIILDEDTWPGNIPDARRGGMGISLLRYFINADRLRRGDKWTKTLLAMMWLPVHGVVANTLVPKFLVDHAAQSIWLARSGNDVMFHYWECVVLVFLQFFSLGLNRWADVVQTRNRGRTGGIRQVHRISLLKKYMHLEHYEHWLFSESQMLYSLIFDCDVVTQKAYFNVFVLLQSVLALLLSLLVAIFLAVWHSNVRGGVLGITLGNVAYIVTLVFVVPIGFGGVWMRRVLTWKTVVGRKTEERNWFKAVSWLITSWRSLGSFSPEDLGALEARISKLNSKFVNMHWDKRDTMNDTGWVTQWIQGIAYSLVLLIGVFALIDYEAFGMGNMSVGTFYALSTIFLLVGKYVKKLTYTLVDFQEAIVSLRDLAALMNLLDLRSQRYEAAHWASLFPQDEPAAMPSVDAVGSLGPSSLRKGLPTVFSDDRATGGHIAFDANVCFMRPSGYKKGLVYAELRLRESVILPLGRLVHVQAENEGILNTFIGLAAKVIHPTGPGGEVNPYEGPRVVVPHGLRLLLLPLVPPTAGAESDNLVDELKLTGAPESLCRALSEAVGLDLSHAVDSLPFDALKAFYIAKAILTDPDVLCACRPLSLVPRAFRGHLANLLRVWQGGGGLPGIAEMLGHPMDLKVHRPRRRTLILGNTGNEVGHLARDVILTVDNLLWRPTSDDDPAIKTSEGAGELASVPPEVNHRRLMSRAASRVAQPCRGTAPSASKADACTESI